MTINVEIHPFLKQHMSNLPLVHKAKWDVPEGTTVGSILKMLEMKEDLEVATVVNDELCFGREQILQDRDRLLLLPFIAGG
jgi:sulfur carrier protein ThiS